MKEVRNYKCKYLQQNTTERRFSDAEDTIEGIDTTVKEKCKMQKASDPKHPGNPGHNEKTKPKDYTYRREQKIYNLKGQ